MTARSRPGDRNASNGMAVVWPKFRGTNLYGKFLDGPIPQPLWKLSNRHYQASLKRHGSKKISLAVLKFTEPSEV